MDDRKPEDRGRSARIDTWIFDLDNTLYPPSARLFDQIGRRMSDFIGRALGVGPDEADRLRDDLWARYGTTLSGLVAEFGIDAEDFLHHSHEIDLSALRSDPGLVRAIDALPGRRIVHTNGPRMHAERVLGARGLEGVFDAVFSIEDAGLISKPAPAAYDAIAELAALDPLCAAMIEDTAENLRVPKARGMTTVLVHADATHHGHVDHSPADLTEFLCAAGDLCRAV